MCRAVTCRTCGKRTWAGCGQHVDQVMAGVPKAQRCPGHPEPQRRAAGWPASSAAVPDRIAQAAASRSARLTAETTALSEAVTMFGSMPTPQRIRSPTAHST